MNWKNIIKRQTSFMDFGMTPPKGTMQRVSGEEEFKTRMPEIRSKLESEKGRSTMRTPQGQVDSSEYFLGELDKVQSYEDYLAFKENYKKQTNLDI
jgi:hypothetical protein